MHVMIIVGWSNADKRSQNASEKRMEADLKQKEEEEKIALSILKRKTVTNENKKKKKERNEKLLEENPFDYDRNDDYMEDYNEFSAVGRVFSPPLKPYIPPTFGDKSKKNLLAIPPVLCPAPVLKKGAYLALHEQQEEVTVPGFFGQIQRRDLPNAQTYRNFSSHEEQNTAPCSRQPERKESPYNQLPSLSNILDTTGSKKQQDAHISRAPSPTTQQYQQNCQQEGGEYHQFNQQPAHGSRAPSPTTQQYQQNRQQEGGEYHQFIKQPAHGSRASSPTTQQYQQNRQQEDVEYTQSNNRYESRSSNGYPSNSLHEQQSYSRSNQSSYQEESNHYKSKLVVQRMDMLLYQQQAEADRKSAELLHRLELERAHQFNKSQQDLKDDVNAMFGGGYRY